MTEQMHTPTLSCTWDGEWFFVSHLGQSLAVYPDQLRPGHFCIGRGGPEYLVVDDGDGFENAQAAIDHAEWMLTDARASSPAA